MLLMDTPRMNQPHPAVDAVADLIIQQDDMIAQLEHDPTIQDYVRSMNMLLGTLAAEASRQHNEIGELRTLIEQQTNIVRKVTDLLNEGRQIVLMQRARIRQLEGNQ